MAQLPDQETLQALLHYEPDTGKLFWKERPLEMFKREQDWKTWNAKFAGQEAFTANSIGYRRGSLFDKRYLAHRVIWKMVTGDEPEILDHEDGVRHNNKWENLRAVTQSDNMRNSSMKGDNTSGVVGVSWSSRKRALEVRIHSTFQGYFTDFEEAVAVRKAAEVQHGYHPNHGRAA